MYHIHVVLACKVNVASSLHYLPDVLISSIFNSFDREFSGEWLFVTAGEFVKINTATILNRIAYSRFFVCSFLLHFQAHLN